MSRRVSLAAVLILLCAGFTYAGVASVRGYRRLFAEPRAIGPSASIDALMRPLQIESMNVLRSAVIRTGWRRDSDIVLVAAVSSMTPTAMTQAHLVAGYALYPRRVWLASWCDSVPASCAVGTISDPFAMLSKHETGQVMLAARRNPFPDNRSRRVSGLLSLVQVH
jgi:hypothetical protein